MALLSFEEELARSREARPFSNGFEYDSWTSIWCYECDAYESCSLLELVLLEERTPAAWEDRSPGALNRYVCHEFKQQVAE